MSRYHLLRLRDVKLALQIVSECRERWADPAAWRLHLVAGVCRLTGMAVGHYAEISLPAPGWKPKIFCSSDVGWRDVGVRDMAYVTAVEMFPNQFDFFPGSQRLVLRAKAGRPAVALREEICPDRIWHKSIIFNEFRRLACTDGNVISIQQRAAGIYAYLDVSQDVAEAAPTLRTKQQVAFLHQEIDPLIGVELATECQRGLHGMSPQLRATLDRLLAGESEKQIAAGLGLRGATVSEYVGKVYRHFGVNSRAELMAYFVRRRPKPQ